MLKRIECLLAVVRARNMDLPGLARMNKRLIEDEGHRNPMGARALEKRMAGWLKGGYRAVLFKVSGETVGYCLYRREGDHWYLRQFFIERPFRRRRLGKAAFRLVRRRYWKNPKRVRVEVLTANKRGRGFWKACGFKEYCLALER